MSFVPSFTITPSSNPAAFTVQDTSVGSDGLITGRTITLYNVDNSVFGTFDFPLSAGASIALTPLTQDVALNVQVTWNNVSGAAIYTSTQIYAFTEYGEQFLYQLTQTQTSNPGIIRDFNYYMNKMILIVELSSANNAINTGQDVYSAQGCINRYNYLIANQSFNF